VLSALLPDRRVIVSAGPGGVGKTTVAASLAALAARSGRRTLVATIDPAPRLADALGLPDLGPVPAPLPPESCLALGIPPGALHAARIDTALSFRRLVESEAPDPERRRRIFDNPIYRQMTSSLTGSQEYAATVALHDFFASGDYDLIVLDTPPTANALDFLDAPRRIKDAVTSPAISWFARAPGDKSVGRFSLRRLTSGGALVLQRLGKFVGSSFLDDLGAFLGDFQGVLGGFLRRAEAVEALLRRPDVGFLLVLAPELPAIDEALTFFERLSSAGLRLDGFIANRVLPAPALRGPPMHQELESLPKLASFRPHEQTAAITALDAAVDFLAQAAEAQLRELQRLGERAPGVPIIQLPLLSHEASSLTALRAIGDHLAAPR
jgi:anion-transporting  ArsA/GET3 family ATPase